MVRGTFAQLLAPGLQHLFNTWLNNPNAFNTYLINNYEEAKEYVHEELEALSEATIIIRDGKVTIVD